jgi:hypothetical protein
MHVTDWFTTILHAVGLTEPGAPLGHVPVNGNSPRPKT